MSIQFRLNRMDGLTWLEMWQEFGESLPEGLQFCKIGAEFRGNLSPRINA